MNMENKLIITPKTKVADVLEAYPQLEKSLITYVPAFSKLQNPVLRRTVGKVATLQQAAAVGNVDINELIAFLRKEVGQNEDSVIAGEVQYNYIRPTWFDEINVVETLFATEMLERGEHPVAKVMSDLKQLKQGSIYRLVVQFLPVPLIDKASSMGFVHWIDKKSETEYDVYFKSKTS